MARAMFISSSSHRLIIHSDTHPDFEVVLCKATSGRAEPNKISYG